MATLNKICANLRHLRNLRMAFLFSASAALRENSITTTRLRLRYAAEHEHEHDKTQPLRVYFSPCTNNLYPLGYKHDTARQNIPEKV